MKPVNVQLNLPDQLAEEAFRLGLLSPSAIELMLRAELHRKQIEAAFEPVERLRIQPGAALSSDDIDAEITAKRNRS